MWVAEFRLVVFRPFVGEVLVGRIMASTHKGIRVSLEFFDDIFIPDNLLFDIAVLYPTNALSPRTSRCCAGAYFGSDHSTQSWKLPVDGDAYNYLEKDELIRFKVEEETFKEATPAPPKVQTVGELDRIEEYKEPIYSLIVLSRGDMINNTGKLS